MIPCRNCFTKHPSLGPHLCISKLNYQQIILKRLGAISLAELVVRAKRVYLAYRRLYPTLEDDLPWDSNFASSHALRRPERSSQLQWLITSTLTLHVGHPALQGIQWPIKYMRIQRRRVLGRGHKKLLDSELPFDKLMVDHTMERNVKISMQGLL